MTALVQLLLLILFRQPRFLASYQVKLVSLRIVGVLLVTGQNCHSCHPTGKVKVLKDNCFMFM